MKHSHRKPHISNMDKAGTPYGIMVTDVISTRINRSRLVACVTALSLLVAMGGGILVNDRASAQTIRTAPRVAASTAATESSYPALRRYAKDLTRLARAGRLDPVSGHDAEINRTIEILSRNTKSNPALIGEQLSTAQVAQGVATRIAAGNVPASLRDKRLFNLSLDALAAHANGPGEFNARLQAVLDDVASAKGDVILFVAQLHQFVGAYAATISTETLRTALEHGLQIVGATTQNAYSNYIAGDKSLAGLFQQVPVEQFVSDTNSTQADDSKKASDENNGEDSSNGFRGDKISADLREMMHSHSPSERVTVIVQVDDLKKLDSMVKSGAIRTDARFPQLGAVKIEAPVGMLSALAANNNARHISLDRSTQSAGHLSLTTGADAVRGSIGYNGSRLDGTGMGIAVLDSGIYANHVNFLGNNDHGRVVYSQDFTGENRTDDPYGHGSHVASIAGGNGRVSNAAYLGIAPNANLINLRVLNSSGTGNVSSTLAALDWVMANKGTYNIRVVNMSLGTAAVDSYKNDPVCRAVRRLVDAGVVVVVAAGNNGKNAAGQKVYGLIHCPGNEPSAITVGAANTFGTDRRNDDGVATYSSRGPTRSYWTDSADVKHYDGLMKPDLVAPGNKIVEAQSPDNLLVTRNPQLDARISPNDRRDQMVLSGTSMATPVVAGAAALLLQANPNLTPNMVKAIFEYTAQRLVGFNTLEQGAGELNIEGAVRLARSVRTNFGNTKPVGAALLNTLLPPFPQSTVAGTTFAWSQGILLGHHWAKGVSLITKYQAVYALGTIVSDDTLLRDGVIVSDGTIISDGVLVSDGTIISDGVLVSDGTIVSDGVLVSDGTIISDGTIAFTLGTIVSDGVLVSDGTIISDGVICSDGTIISDGTIVSDSFFLAQAAAVEGDVVEGLDTSVDTGIDCLNY